jgi:hypothetical protein
MLGKLEKVDIREIWKNEALDFTKWLAQNDNLKLLSDEIGIDINIIKTEASVGAFSADILAEEDGTDRKIIIENQLEQTNHDHLGKIITYASGFDASILIWIAKEIREEHRQAINWLNEKADSSLFIFAIKMEVWKIGNSEPAPKFQVICSPNNWAKAVKQSSDDQLTDTNIAQLDYWTQFSEYLSANSKKLKARTPKAQHWYDIGLGNSHMHISLIVSFQSNFIRTDIYIPNDKPLFQKLYAKKDQIEKELGFSPSWEELPDAKASRIKLQRDDVDVNSKNQYIDYFKWYVETAEKYATILAKYW